MKITTITPVYNNGLYLEDCIQSLLWQTYSNREFIFVDDGSVDNSSEILRKYEENQKVTVIYKDRNGGIASAYRDAISRATGDILTFLDADDIAMRDRLSSTAKQFMEDKRVGIVYSKMDLIKSNGARFNLSLRLPGYVNNDNLFMQLFRRGFFTGSGMSIRNIPTLKTDLDIICCDYYYSLQLVDQGYHFSYIDKTLTQYRIHKGNTSNQSSRLLSDIVKVQGQYSSEYLFDKWKKEGHSLIDIYTTVGINSYYFRKDYKMAEQFFVNAVNLGGNIESFFYLGYILFQQGDMQKSFRYLKKAYDLAPICFQVIHNYALLLAVHSGDYRESRNLLQKAKQIQPFYTLISRNLEYLINGDINALKLIHFLSDEDAVLNSYCRLLDS
ncbi:glycosyltransferase [Paenibacillus vini]|uniref:glycosyltransferase n=1 Tax=Paenibacillus vini TaxID=1476024 RepID=UPI0025B6C6F3|nr:glycosyltransferase [Paenibacillus vini]MDN4066450.1 glycosyltransferase [Paenibacillus vini]